MNPLNIAIQVLREQVELNEEKIKDDIEDFLSKHDWILNQIVNVPTNERSVNNVLAEIKVINYGRAISFLTYVTKLHENEKISTEYLKLEVQRLTHNILCKKINMNLRRTRKVKPSNLTTLIKLASVSVGLYALYNGIII